LLGYSVTDSTIGDGSAAGNILDNGNTIGTWSVSGFSFTKLSATQPYTPTIGVVTAATGGNSYNKPGVGIKILGNGVAQDGVNVIQYSVSWSLNPGYTLDSTSFWAKYPGTVGTYGPASPVNPGGSISLLGFASQAVVSDPSDNLYATDGQTFTSGQDLGGWKAGTASGTWNAVDANWQLTAPSAGSYTLTLDYTSQSLSAANEATAFNLNISAVPEPDTWALLAGGAAFMRWRKRAKVS
jgi:hypothetical protein